MPESLRSQPPEKRVACERNRIARRRSERGGRASAQCAGRVYDNSQIQLSGNAQSATCPAARAGGPTRRGCSQQVEDDLLVAVGIQIELELRRV
jgi:hypothetical protein